MSPSRNRGAQPGNQNARTHGFYSKRLTPEQQQSLQAAASLDGLDQEIAILRVKIASILDDDPHNDKVLMLAFSALARLLHMKQLLDRQDRNGLIEAIRLVLRDIGGPLGFPRDPASHVIGGTGSLVQQASPPVSPSLTNNESRSP